MLFPSFGKVGESHDRRLGYLCKMGNKYATIYTVHEGGSDAWHGKTLYRSLDCVSKEGLVFPFDLRGDGHSCQPNVTWFNRDTRGAAASRRPMGRRH